MYIPRPFNVENLTCHVCGKPAKWYDREFHSTYVLGEALCDDCAKSDWKEIKTLKPYIGLDGKIVCDFEACPLKKNVNLLDVLKMIRKIIRNSREAPNVLDTIDWTAMNAIHDYLANKAPKMEIKS